MTESNLEKKEEQEKEEGEKKREEKVKTEEKKRKSKSGTRSGRGYKKYDSERHLSEVDFDMEILKCNELINCSNFDKNKVPALDTKAKFMFLLGPQGRI